MAGTQKYPILLCCVNQEEEVSDPLDADSPQEGVVAGEHETDKPVYEGAVFHHKAFQWTTTKEVHRSCEGPDLPIVLQLSRETIDGLADIYTQTLFCLLRLYCCCVVVLAGHLVVSEDLIFVVFLLVAEPLTIAVVAVE